MANKKGAGCGVLVLGTLVLSVGATALCCGGGVVLLWLSPRMFLEMMVEPQPLAVAMPAPDPVAAEASRARICGDILAVRPTTVSGDELTQFGLEGAIPELKVFRAQIAGDDLTMDVSVELEPGQYINLHGKGGFTMDHGWFTDSTFDEATFSGWDLGGYVVGQQLAPDMNRSLANERAKTPELGPLLDAWDTVAVRGGVIELVPNAGAAQVMTVCAPYTATPAAGEADVEAIEAVQAP
jgi:hypothetical protein